SFLVVTVGNDSGTVTGPFVSGSGGRATVTCGAPSATTRTLVGTECRPSARTDSPSTLVVNGVADVTSIHCPTGSPNADCHAVDGSPSSAACGRARRSPDNRLDAVTPTSTAGRPSRKSTTSFAVYADTLADP